MLTPLWSQVKVLSISPAVTNAKIKTFVNEDHKVYFNDNTLQAKDLLVFIPSLGQSTSSLDFFSRMAANNGINIIILSPPHTNILYQSCEHSIVSTCFEDFHRELVEGKDFTPWIEVDSLESIEHRLKALIIYLSKNEKTQNWINFIKTGNLNYADIILAGLADGAGRAATIAKNNEVKRLICFSGPKDFSLHYYLPPIWLSGSKWKTNSSKIFAFVHASDEYDFQKEILDSIGLTKYGKAVNVNQTAYPYNNSHHLITNTAISISQRNGSTITDDATPKTSGLPQFESVWKYLLDLPLQTTALKSLSVLQAKIYPNPIKTGKKLIYSDEQIISYNIYDPTGKKIKNGIYNDGIEIALPTGIYLLKAQSRIKTFTNKIVVY